jgi:UDP-N-acetylglucosamine 2-epimerase (non-hydrolysing)
MAKPLIAMVVGTRPDAIKSAPVALEIRKFSQVADLLLVSTGQHKEMLAQALGAFGLKPDVDLEIMRHDQTLAEVTCGAMEGLDRILRQREPDFIMAQGDTTTTFAASLVAFYRRIQFGHIEAGLRTDTVHNPFPEEFNRRATGLISSIHFPPTTWAAGNLVQEGKDPTSIYVTGNTGIDAVNMTAETAHEKWFPEHSGRVVLLTTHRRENWGEPQEDIAAAALEVVERFEDVLLVVPMHRNPKVRQTLEGKLVGHPRIKLIEPPDYAPFVKLMQRSTLILTDSGGVQEEAPAFGIPVLVLRDTTERPEGVEAGTAKLVGTNRQAIVGEASALLSDENAYAKMAHAVSPYGDGRAAQRIRYVVLAALGVETDRMEMWT